ncbi:Nramp family divalent metal transporter [Natrononativus amylolyticus]|uniref:Nramp family divalent metal transporter n=1 Tax=Natrononativus amylolyticus TaxID=2963434 RepID=UPI0020CC1721|nr:Nramp family divalent metal transporter [Natrononativus amylolyticus]
MGIIDTQRLRELGPAALISAAFIGPGTITTASALGAEYAYLLVWTVVFSITATIILQEMSARLGLVTGKGLGEAIYSEFKHPVIRYSAIGLVVAAILIGTAAYQVSNFVSSGEGLVMVTGTSTNIWTPLAALVAFAVLWVGSYKLLEYIFIGIVGLMGFAFIFNAIVIGPNFSGMASGFIPTIPDGSAYLIAGVIGTTIVGYNLFLHASTVQEKWGGTDGLEASRTDTIFMMSLGGIIMLSIMVTAAGVFPEGTELGNVSQMADQLEPIFGGWAFYFFAVGFFAAAFSSAITAPLAAAYATAGVLGWERDMKATRFRAIWVSVLAFAFIFSTFEYDVIQLIIFAQVANGLLLPILAVFLLYAMNNDRLLGEYTNSTTQNILGALVLVVVIIIASQTLYDQLVLGPGLGGMIPF